MRARLSGGVLAHLGKALRAAKTAPLTSSADDNPRVADCSPVAGLKTGAVRALCPSWGLPSMKFGTLADTGSSSNSYLIKLVMMGDKLPINSNIRGFDLQEM
jgi:hypothetical protein